MAKNVLPMVTAAVAALLLHLAAPAASSNPSIIWGVATSAYQIEGAWDVDGKGVSIWDVFSTQPNKIVDNSTGQVACRSYEKYKEDVQLLKQLGVQSYRFSISWPRVIPTGRLADGVNQKGIDYYEKLVDELLANGITPMATLYHWDLPVHLQVGYSGWESEQIIPDFVDYARLMFQRLGSKVKWWITFNEPWVFNVMGYGTGEHAPGVDVDLTRKVYVVAHNLLRAHAKTYRVYVNEFKALHQGRVGITLNGAFTLPKTQSEEDKKAAERAMQFIFGWYADPVYYGDYPEEMRNRIARKSREANLTQSRLPEFTIAEKVELRNSSDFFGLNYYSSSIAAHNDSSSTDGYFADQDVESSQDPSWPGSGSSWLKVTPFGIRSAINWLSNRYGNPPIVVTENGLSDNSGVTTDPHRVNFYREYIGNVTQAKNEDGRNVIGYFAWSLMDNFEWARGYTEYFGIVAVNFTDPERPRTLKDSAKWYRDYISSYQTTARPPTSTTKPPTSTTKEANRAATAGLATVGCGILAFMTARLVSALRY